MLGKFISQALDKGTTVQTPCLPCADIAAFADDRLDRVKRERVESHLADCRECYGLYADTIAAKLIATGRADAPSGDKRVVKALLYIVPAALAACLALVLFSGNFKDGQQGTGAPAELKMPVSTPMPVGEMSKKADEFRNMTGHESKK